MARQYRLLVLFANRLHKQKRIKNKLLAKSLQAKADENRDPKDRLRALGLRVTDARLAILSFFDEMEISEDLHGPFTVEQVHRAVERKGVDLVTVYRCLEQFEKNQLIRKCHFGDGVARFESLDEDHHHHHVICTECKMSRALPSCELPSALESSVKTLGYSKVQHSLEFFGVCQECQS